MVYFVTPFVGAVAILSSFTSAAPLSKRDSSIGEEVAVSAPNGVIESDTAELASQTALAAYYQGSSSSAAYGSMYTPPPSGGSYTSAPSYGASYTTTSMASMMTDSSMMMDSSSSMMYDSSSSSMMYDSSSAMYSMSSSSMMYDSSSTMMYDSSSTMYMSSSTMYAPPMATYGSGSASWSGGSGYDSCVQQCMASYPAAMSVGSYVAPTSTYASAGSTGTNGVTHTVIVAPTQGVLRYVPFATNASVGDTIQFVWGAGPHTVTKSSEFSVCNATLDAPFASGKQNKSFVFNQVVNDTNPTFYYCGVPTHCEKGMFGIINPPSAGGSATSVGSMMDSWAASNPDIAYMMSYTSNMTANNDAAHWGNSIDVASMLNATNNDPSVPAMIASNVFYSRLVFAQNPGTLGSDGKFTPNNDLKIPSDISNILASASPSSAPVNAAAGATSTSSSAASSGTSSSSSSGSSSASAATASSTNGALGVRSSGALVGVAVLAATFFAL
ncbi:hypothetical protein SISNIDRAFT_462127 [Sistotremastrum niveocremeum HHB9708]|uniref:Phytocyanin domain-containing protein n=2 Tax=Sistotremastraceae TaxID=3402574 RepID=A0A165AMP5_9AGAM|nr:hypothetical protein SISNIDRAFT_462127 [Sistotremastrum niveocremeum HHB9708]KZT42122.1 hypothetical protein SISSUDRAFT_1030827 [Sistotremastrum suecicum HHB10207 ss-3]